MAARHIPDYLPANWPDHVDIPTPEQWAQALQEEAMLPVAIAEAAARAGKPMATPESIAAGEEHIRQAREKAQFKYESAGPSVIDELLKGRPDAPFVEPPAKPSDSFTDAMNSRKPTSE